MDHGRSKRCALAVHVPSPSIQSLSKWKLLLRCQTRNPPLRSFSQRLYQISHAGAVMSSESSRACGPPLAPRSFRICVYNSLKTPTAFPDPKYVTVDILSSMSSKAGSVMSSEKRSSAGGYHGRNEAIASASTTVSTIYLNDCLRNFISFGPHDLKIKIPISCTHFPLSHHPSSDVQAHHDNMPLSPHTDLHNNSNGNGHGTLIIKPKPQSPPKRFKL